MTTDTVAEHKPFQAEVAELLHLMVHSVYSDKAVFLRELISNAADAYEKLRYEAIATPALLGDDPKPRITLAIDAEHGRLAVEDNGIGMGRDEMVEALGTIAGMMNASAVLVFLFSPQVHWLQAAIACAGAMLGGIAGARLIHRVNEKLLRLFVVIIGVALTAGLFLRAHSG